MEKAKISFPIYAEVVVDLDTGEVTNIVLDRVFGDAYHVEILSGNEVVLEGDPSRNRDDEIIRTEFDVVDQPDGSKHYTNRRDIPINDARIKRAWDAVNGMSLDDHQPVWDS